MNKQPEPCKLILYSKPGCHLCEGLQEKLNQVKIVFDLEVRDITTSQEWFEKYQYEIPVLCYQEAKEEKVLPRVSPRASVAQIEQMLQQKLF